MNFPIIGDGMHHMWDIRLVIDMFLGGAGAGAFVVAIIASLALGWDRTAYIRKVASVFAPIAIGVSMLLLLSELTQPARALLPLFSGETSSPLMWGMWIQLGFLVVSGIFAVGALGWVGTDGGSKTIGIIGAVLGGGVTIYHGVFLADNFARPLWAIGGLPLLFPIVAIATGAAVLVLASGMAGSDRDAQASGQSVARVMVVSSVAVLLGSCLYLWALMTTSSEAQAGAELLRSGELSGYTWVGVLLAGAIGVIVGLLGIRGSSSMASQSGEAEASSLSMMLVIAAILILVAGYSLRYIIVIGGQIIPVLPVS